MPEIDRGTMATPFTFNFQGEDIEQSGDTSTGVTSTSNESQMLTAGSVASLPLIAAEIMDLPEVVGKNSFIIQFLRRFTYPIVNISSRLCPTLSKILEVHICKTA